MTYTGSKIYNCVIALGGNLDPRMEALQKALDIWRERDDIEILGVGRVYETEPEPKPGFVFDNDFLNTCIAIRTPMDAVELIKVCKEVEKLCGRDFEKEYGTGEGDRVIDCDLIFHGDEIMNRDGITVPHEKWDTRNFVILPLSDIREFLTDWQSGLVKEAYGKLDPSKVISPYGDLKLNSE